MQSSLGRNQERKALPSHDLQFPFWRRSVRARSPSFLEVASLSHTLPRTYWVFTLHGFPASPQRQQFHYSSFGRCPFLATFPTLLSTTCRVLTSASYHRSFTWTFHCTHCGICNPASLRRSVSLKLRPSDLAYPLRDHSPRREGVVMTFVR